MLKIKDRRIAVIGLSKRTGVAVVKMLVNSGAKVVVSDVKKEDDLKEEIKMLEGYQVEFEFAGHGERSLNCDLIIVSPGVPLDLPFFEKAAKKNIPIISEIELAYQYTDGKLIAVTGTNGKTTTTSLLGNILLKSKVGRVKIGGNIGIPMIREAIDLTRNDWLVVEVSSFQLEAIKDFKPHISLFLNFTPDHLDRHKTIENYWQNKRKIFLNQQESDYAIINIDDPEVVRAAEICDAQKFAVSLLKEVKQGIFFQDGSLIIRINNQEKHIIRDSEIFLKGRHNLMNVAFACMAAYLAGADIKSIREGIINYIPEAHRLEEIAFFDNILFIDDSKATNPDAAIKALQSYQLPIVLIAGGQDRNADFQKLAQLIEQRVKFLILLGETKEFIKKEVLKKGYSAENICLVEDMKEAVKTAVKFLTVGDCLLLSPGCPSWDMYSSYKERGNDFQREVELMRRN